MNKKVSTPFFMRASSSIDSVDCSMPWQDQQKMHKRDDFAFPGLCIFPFTRGVEKLCSTPKVEKAGTSDLQQRGATFYIAALYFFEISYGWATTKCHQNPCINLLFHPGLGADLCKLCGCGYLGHVAPGSSPGTDKIKIKKQKKE